MNHAAPTPPAGAFLFAEVLKHENNVCRFVLHTFRAGRTCTSMGPPYDDGRSFAPGEESRLGTGCQAALGLRPAFSSVFLKDSSGKFAFRASRSVFQKTTYSKCGLEKSPRKLVIAPSQRPIRGTVNRSVCAVQTPGLFANAM